MMTLSSKICAAMVPLGLMLACACPAALATTTIVNISATTHGIQQQSSQPFSVGAHITPITCCSPTSPPLNQLAFAAGTYTVTNAISPFYVPAGANPDFTAWNFNQNDYDSWTWEFVIAAHGTTFDTVIMDGDPGVTWITQNGVAGRALVEDFDEQFTLTEPTTLDFMVRDWYLNDNLDGVAIKIESASASGTPEVPEPTGIGLLALGLLALGGFARKRLWGC